MSSVLFTGDIALTDECRRSSMLFSSPLLECFNSADLVCINLELPFTDNNCRMAPNTHPSLASQAQMAAFLKPLKPSVVNIGTNHCMDGGREGIDLTRETVVKLGACSIGAGLDESEARRPCCLSISGKRFIFLNYCKKGNFTACGKRAGAALLSEPNLRADLPAAAAMCDFLVVSMHMGMEFSKSVHPMYRKLAHLAVDLGASCVVGHHPHVIQGIETYRRAPIFYSLGNLLFDNHAGAIPYMAHWEERHKGILAKVLFTDSGISYEIIPTVSMSRPLSVGLADDKEKTEILNEISHLSTDVLDGTSTDSAETEAFGAIAKREAATIVALTKIHGCRFLWYFIKDLKVRHFKMLFRSLWHRIAHI